MTNFMMKCMYLNNYVHHYLVHSHFYRNIHSFLRCWCISDYSCRCHRYYRIQQYLNIIMTNFMMKCMYLNNYVHHYLVRSHFYRNIHSFLRCWCISDYSCRCPCYHCIHQYLNIIMTNFMMKCMYLNNYVHYYLVRSHFYRNIHSFLRCWCISDYSCRCHRYHRIQQYLNIIMTNFMMKCMYLNNYVHHYLVRSHFYRNIHSFLRCWCISDYSCHCFHCIQQHLNIIMTNFMMKCMYLNNYVHHYLVRSHFYRNIHSFLRY